MTNWTNIAITVALSIFSAVFASYASYWRAISRLSLLEQKVNQVYAQLENEIKDRNVRQEEARRGIETMMSRLAVIENDVKRVPVLESKIDRLIERRELHD